jgi:hypothetical protein
MPIGRLIRNSARQSEPNRSALISRPATTGPATVDRPMTGPNAANALPICAGGKMSRISPNACGMSTAADSPCTARAPISDSGDQANAHAPEASTNPLRPTISIRLRPNMSPRRPPAISPTPIASVYAAAIHSSADVDIERSCLIDGAATLTIVESRMFMIIAASTTAKPVHMCGRRSAAEAGGAGGAECAVWSRLDGRSRTVVISCSFIGWLVQVEP